MALNTNQKPMTELEQELLRELEEFKSEKERVKQILGNQGKHLGTEGEAD